MSGLYSRKQNLAGVGVPELLTCCASYETWLDNPLPGQRAKRALLPLRCRKPPGPRYMHELRVAQATNPSRLGAATETGGNTVTFTQCKGQKSNYIEKENKERTPKPFFLTYTLRTGYGNKGKNLTWEKPILVNNVQCIWAKRRYNHHRHDS